MNFISSAMSCALLFTPSLSNIKALEEEKSEREVKEAAINLDPSKGALGSPVRILDGENTILVSMPAGNAFRGLEADKIEIVQNDSKVLGKIVGFTILDTNGNVIPSEIKQEEKSLSINLKKERTSGRILFRALFIREGNGQDESVIKNFIAKTSALSDGMRVASAKINGFIGIPSVVSR